MSDFSKPVEHAEDVTTTGPTTLIGKVKIIIFERSLFRIASVEVEDAKFNWDQDSITVKGQLGDIVEGDRYEFEGRVVDDKRYGLQFASTGCHIVLPHTSKELASYLKFHQVKLRFPQKSPELLFAELGSNAVNNVIDDPDIIKKVTAMNAGDREKIAHFFENLDFGNTTGQIIEQLKKLGFNEWQVNKIFDNYGVRTLSILKDNPYRFAEDLTESGITFKKMDEIATEYYHCSFSDPRRIRAAINCSLTLLTNAQGGTFVKLPMLFTLASRILGNSIQQDLIINEFKQLISNKDLYLEDQENVFSEYFYNAEWAIAQKVLELASDDHFANIDLQKFDSTIHKVEKDQGYHYDDIQIEAIQKALSSALLLITGGPGTGKTTILNGIVNTYLSLFPQKSKDDILFAAPTGRAAKQITSVTGVEASTIHRLLGLTADTTENSLLTMEFDELDADFLIVDEMSMTSTALFSALMSAVGDNTHVILVGDVDQLPSVGPGQVFRDLLSENKLPKIRLSHIYRQNEDSSIIPLANKINKGDVDTSDFCPKVAHRQFIRARMDQVPELIYQAVNLYHKKHGVALMDMQIMAPIHGGIAGTDYLNLYLQNKLNPDDGKKPAFQIGDKILRVGDKVMQTVNDPDRNVFNGDLGIISAIEGKNVIHGQKKARANQKIVVNFDGVEVEYLQINEINALELAYCMTIHKAQGSQAQVVILPLVNEYFPSNPNVPTILHRNLLYTAVTRSSQALLMIGNPEAFVRCAKSPAALRQTGLKQKIEAVDKAGGLVQNEHLEQVDNKTNKTHYQDDSPVAGEITPEMVENETIDPLIGMDGITPYDF